MSSIRPADLDARLGSSSGDDLYLLDIRPEPAFESGAIGNSHNIPVYNELRRGDKSALREHLGDVPADRDVVVICKKGIVAKRATSILREEGYDASTLLGGMSGWNGYQNNSLGYNLRRVIWGLR